LLTLDRKAVSAADRRRLCCGAKIDPRLADLFCRYHAHRSQLRPQPQNLAILRRFRKRLALVSGGEQLAKLASNAEECVMQVNAGLGMLGQFLRNLQCLLCFGSIHGTSLATLIRRDIKNLNAVVITNFKVHCFLAKFLANSNYTLPRFEQKVITANDGNSPAFITIQLGIFWVKPLALGNAFIRSAAKLQGEIVYDSV
jgi:hypothetical protein